MIPYSKHRPTQYDRHLPLEDREHWLVFPVSRTRDSNPLEESNFAVALQTLGGEGETVEVHRFGHWGPGWYDIILIDPADGLRVEAAEKMIDDLDTYPVLDDDDLCARERLAADETWKNCYSTAMRVQYIREHRSQFEFHNFADMLGCVRGIYFAGCASDLIG